MLSLLVKELITKDIKALPSADWKPRFLKYLRSLTVCNLTERQWGWTLVRSSIEIFRLLHSSGWPILRPDYADKLDRLEILRAIIANSVLENDFDKFSFVCLEFVWWSGGSQDQILDKSIVINVNNEINLKLVPIPAD